MASANSAKSATRVRLPRGRHFTISRPANQEVSIKAEAVFSVANNTEYRKLLDRFADGNPIVATTADGFKFQLLT